MANKLPVICSDTCGTSCYVEEGENGYVFKSGDLEDLVNKIEKVIENGNIEIMGMKSFNLSKDNYSIDVFKNKINKLI